MLFEAVNHVVLVALAVICLLPLINVFCISISSSAAAAAGRVYLWPVDFTLQSYAFASSKPQFLVSLVTTVKRTALGSAIGMLLCVLTAYPLSKRSESFKGRTAFVWFFFFSTLFGGGLVPTFFVVLETKLIDTIWALVIPESVAVFNVILLLNFFRALPVELEEAALLDGAGHWTVLFKVYIPLSKAALATILLFQMVYHWNEWFHGMIYMNRPDRYPLQSYLRTVLSRNAALVFENLEDMKYYHLVSDETSKAAQIFIGALPIIITYPFLQKYFTTGIVLGSVKG
ncbi:MAG TPA: carbohydrate ABC transporter permease [Clostridia bacterium]|nr:carbohydrate ABC transporter permease [Clostridia bacterium]